MTMLAGCGQDNSSASRFGQEDLSLSIGGTRYSLKSNIETVIVCLGPDYDYSEDISRDYDGLDKTYSYKHITQ